MKSCILGYYPLANPKTKPAETLDTSGIPTVDNVAELVPSMVFETCVIASTTQLIPTASVILLINLQIDSGINDINHIIKRSTEVS